MEYVRGFLGSTQSMAAEEVWMDMLVEWGVYVNDVDAYNARLHEEASQLQAQRPTTNWCAMFLVAITHTRKLAFTRTEVTATRHVLRHDADVWVGVTNTSQQTCRYDLWLAGVHRTFHLRSGESQLLLDTNAVPSVCLPYARGQCRIDSTSPPFVVVNCLWAGDSTPCQSPWSGRAMAGGGRKKAAMD